MDIRNHQLFLGGCAVEDLATAFGTPLYVYEEQIIRSQCRLFRESFAHANPEIHFALKANFNPALLKIMLEEGLGLDAVSPWEVRLGLETGFSPSQIIFTGNNTTEEELRYCIESGVLVNLGSLAELELYGRIHPGGPVALRINPDVGAGHHHHVITGGPRSKFGIYHTEQDAIAELLTRYNLRLIGIHSHIGTGILKTEEMLAAMEIILTTASRFSGLEFIDFGGGFGIPYRPGQTPLPLQQLGAAMAERMAGFCKTYGNQVRMKLEPGRFLTAQAGTLLVRVTNRQSTPDYNFVGTDSGFNHLIRPAMYGAYHEIINATANNGPAEPVVVAGNICESGDVFTHNHDGLEPREVPQPQIGHLLALRDAGAYGMSLASNYNFRARPAEVLVNNGEARLIRRRETYEDLTGLFPAE